jgi:AraC-like DNA-binding protein
MQDEALLLLFWGVSEGAAAARTNAAQRARMEYLLAALRSEQALPDQTASAQLQHHALCWLLAEVQRCRFEPGAGALPGLVIQALTHIEAHACTGLGLTELARALHKSAGHVTTALREATGSTAQEWIIRFRMAEARRRLLHTAEAVEQIAEWVGYEDVTHFIRMFRRHHDGLTPAAWRVHAAGERSDKQLDKTE